MYNEYFGFREKPFNVTPDPKYFYENPVYQEAYASLLYGIRERKGFIVLSGEVGTGKTTLLRRLMSEPEEDVRFVFFYNTTLSFEELVSFACDELRLDVKGFGRLQKIRALNEFLTRQSLRGGTVVLLVDEAQNLTDDVLENLRLLSNLETATEKLLQIVLVGQTELETILGQPQLRQIKQRVALHCRLDRLKAREVGPFIQHRLSVAGFNRGELFTSDAVDMIASSSRGIPRLINIICDNALLTAYATSAKKVSVDMIREVVADLNLMQEHRPTKPSQVTSSPAPRPDVIKNSVEPVEAKIDLSKEQKPPVGNGNGHTEESRSKLFKISTLSVLVLLIACGIFYESETFSWLSETLESIPSVTNLSKKIFPEPSTTSERPARVSIEPVASSAGQVEAAVNKNDTREAELHQLPTHSEQSSSEPAKPVNKAVVVSWGTTLSRIASETYGSNKMLLAMDILKEANPDIQDANWILAGKNLTVPPLTRETLIRQQGDNSYQFILDSFAKSRDAEIFSKAVRGSGYETTIVPHQISQTLTLYRVEIRGLKSQQAAYQAWEVATSKGWISPAETPRSNG
jgi:type II secretory pathway predicted ATPase ExeA